jgi:DNA polymerase-3 subunit gamma/tau
MADQTNSGAYRVLARKYRPQSFADLIGQEAMVRTLSNAFSSNRIHQAYIFTGVRGVGKTTTARIVAKGLNCIGPDGTGGPTIEPCGQCDPCQRIMEGRFIDVLEIDAASSTGVDSIRELNRIADGRPSVGRFKVFIIDEVHMLSTQAFNAMLKTLEEPRSHMKFIMATTEIRKVPVTILSRCQRFDLRRIEPEAMLSHLQGILTREGVTIAGDALGLIVRAAEGSVRDALSLLDQAIAHGAGDTSVADVRAMLGLADRGRVIDLLDLILRGDAAGALAELSAQYAEGADPLAVLRDLAEVTHWLSVCKITPDAAEDPTIAPDERERGRVMAAGLPMRVLSRMWQMLLKALEEVALAPNAMMAAEMAVIRMTHVADLPDPEALLRRLTEGEGAPAQGSATATPAPAPAPTAMAPAPAPRLSAVAGGAAARALPAPAQPEAQAALARFQTFPDVVALIREQRDMRLLYEVEHSLRLAHYAPGRIEFEPGPGAPANLAATLAQRLQGWTGARWGVSVVSEGGGPTIAEDRDATDTAARAAAMDDPVVQAVLAAFPKARITAVLPLAVPGTDGAAPDGAVPDGAATDDGEGPGDDWNPFEDD